MQSDAENVDRYLDGVPPERREVLAALRAVCVEELTGFEESMRSGMPVYLRDGEGEVAWASQKQYISLYVTRSDVLETYREQLAHLNVGKGCIRYRKPAAIDLDLVRTMLADVSATRGPTC